MDVRKFLFKYHNCYRYFEEAAKGEFEFKCLQLSESEVGKFYKKVGKQIDRDGKGYVPINMLLEKLKLKSSLFTTRLFSMLDPGETGLINFSEFLLILWNFLTVDPLSLGYILFDIYDVDGSKTFEFEEVLLCVKELFGDKPNPHAKKIMEQLDELNFLAVTNELFDGMCRNFRDFLIPVREEQSMLRKHFFGVKFWEKKAKQRSQWTGNKYIPLKELLEMQAKRLNITRRDIYRGLEYDADVYYIKSSVKDIRSSKQIFPQRGITVPEIVYERSKPSTDVEVYLSDDTDHAARNQNVAKSLKSIFGNEGHSSYSVSLPFKSFTSKRPPKSDKAIFIDQRQFFENRPKKVRTIKVRSVPKPRNIKSIQEENFKRKR